MSVNNLLHNVQLLYQNMVFLNYNTRTSKTKNYSTYEKWKKVFNKF